MNYHTINYILIIITCCLLACTPRTTKSITDSSDTTKIETIPFIFPYDIDNPQQTFILPNELQEISGLTFTPDGKAICAIQDENGLLFHINKTTGLVESSEKFYKDGDYEALECIGDHTYIIKGTGTMYQVSKVNADSFAVIKYKSPIIFKKYDIEGMCYRAQDHSLLIASKNHADKELQRTQFFKPVFRFDLEKMELDSTPVFDIRLEDIQHYLKTTQTVKNAEKLAYFLEPNQQKFSFCPSAIAIHPQTSNIYITSSVGKLLLVLNPKGEIIHLEKLSKKIHRQPEGLLIDKDGTLYISNEGKDDKATIQVFLKKNRTKIESNK